MIRLSDNLDQDAKPVLKAPFAPLGENDTVFWDGDRQYPYQAYIVEIVSVTDTQIEFNFVKLATGKVVEKPHTVKFAEAPLVWRHAPSTVIGGTKGKWGILFLNNEVAMDPLKAAMADAGSGTGKWPRTSGLNDDPFLKLAARVLEMVEGRSDISAQTKATFEEARNALTAETKRGRP